VRPEKNAETVQLKSWVQGYMSGANGYQHNADFLIELDAPAIFAWLDNYCRQHPLEKLINASDALISELTMRAAAADPKWK
jgi:hypothetical protein